MARVARVSVDLAANSAEFVSGLGRANAALNSSARQWQRHLSSMDARMAAVSASMKSGLAGVAGALGTAELAGQLYQVNARFQDLKSGLEVATGSAKAADVAFAGLREFARSTPFELAEVVTAFTKLRNLGLDPANEALRAYGDIASSFSGKSIIDVIEAVADASTGEFERLKEFGIKASASGDKVKFTFKGITTEVGKNAGEIEKFLIKLGADNFGGAMDKRMANLSGLTSNLKDSFDDLLVTIGTMGANAAMESGLKNLSDAISATSDNLGTIVNVGGAAASVVGGLLVARAAGAAFAVMQTQVASAAAGIAMMNTFGTAATARMVAMSAATGVASAAFKGMSAALAFIGGPAGAAVAATSAAIYFMATNQSTAEKAAEAHASAMGHFNSVIDGSKGKVKELTAEVRALRQAQLEAARDAVQASIRQQEVYARAGNFKIDRVAFESGLPRGEAEAMLAPVRDLQQAFLQGNMSAADLFAQTSALADQDSRLKPIVQIMREWADPLVGATQNLDEINAALAVLGGNANEAQKKLVGIVAPAAKPSAGPTDAETKKAEAIAKQIQALQFQEAQLARTSREQAIYSALQTNSLDITTKQGAAVAEAAGKLYDKTEAVNAAKEAQERLNQSESDAWDVAMKQTEARDSIAASMNEEVADNERLIAALQVSEAEYERVAAAIDLVNQYKAAGVTMTAEEIAKVDEVSAKLGEQRAEMDSLKDAAAESRRVQSDMTRVIGTATEDAILKAKSLREVLAGLLQDMARIAARAAITKPLEGIFGSLMSGAGSGLSNLYTYGNVQGVNTSGVSGVQTLGNAGAADTLAFTGYANGTNNAPPGMAWVGERGPELMRFKGGEQVYPSGLSKQIAAASTRGFADGAFSAPVMSQGVSQSDIGGGGLSLSEGAIVVNAPGATAADAQAIALAVAQQVVAAAAPQIQRGAVQQSVGAVQSLANRGGSFAKSVGRR